MKTLKKLLHTIFSISGFVPENMTFLRAFFMIGSLAISMFILPNHSELDTAILYFTGSTIVYVGFIFTVLPERGLRLVMIEKFGEKKAYLYYEGFLAFAFFHNGVGLTFISQSSVGSGFFEILPETAILFLAAFLFILGLVTKVWSAYVVGIPVYYWKDMFLRRSVSEFVVTGPYKYFSNPMYGIGQLQVYAMAIYYNSSYGLIFGALNQGLIFLFYFLVEKPFIYKTYIQQSEPSGS
jgi:hypothetical protein